MPALVIQLSDLYADTPIETLVSQVEEALLRAGLEVDSINPWDSPTKTSSDPVTALDSAFRS